MTKSEYKALYRYQTCPFVPTKDVPFEEMPDVVEGALLFVCDERYTSCDHCEVEIDCDEQHIFCIYRGEQSNPDEEMTLCESCHHDLKSEFQNDGFQCDDWELENATC